MDEVALEVIERAVLREALGGATRTELWLAARTALMFASQEQFAMALARLSESGDVDEADGRWLTSASGNARLERLRERG